MSTAVPGRTRARDLDRAHTAGVLDSAYAEGQLGAAEYHDRIAAARGAKTLGELSDLVADLQNPSGVGTAVPAPDGEPGYPPSTRARTADREAAAALLDRAYGEGQLSDAEHRAAMDLLAEATTLGDLTELIGDLQGSRSAPVAPRPADPGRQGRYFAVLGAVALAVAFGTFSLTARGSEPQAAQPPAAAAPEAAADRPGLRPELDTVEPIVIGTPDLVTAEGFAHFLAEYHTYFGDPLTDEITLHPDHADIERAVPGQPNRLVHYDYRAGFQQSRDITTRKTDTPVIDLATVNAAAIGAALPTAVEMTRVPEGKVRMIRIEIFAFPPARGLPVVVVYVGNSFDESGRLVLSPAGEVLRVWQFEG